MSFLQSFGGRCQLNQPTVHLPGTICPSLIGIRILFALRAICIHLIERPNTIVWPSYGLMWTALWNVASFFDSHCYQHHFSRAEKCPAVMASHRTRTSWQRRLESVSELHGWPAFSPLSTLSRHRSRYPLMTRGHDGSLLLTLVRPPFRTTPPNLRGEFVQNLQHLTNERDQLICILS